MPPRLAAIAAQVPAGARLADVGTDHGLLPIWLLQRRKISCAIASDLRPGPLEHAVANAAACGVSGVRFLLCDGLDGVAAGEADTVVIAGMGGETIADILSRAPWTRDGAHLLLQPMSKPEALRGALADLGLRVRAETLAADSGRLYAVLAAEGGPADAYSAAELYTGLWKNVRADPLFPQLLRELQRRTEAAARGLEQSNPLTCGGLSHRSMCAK